MRSFTLGAVGPFSIDATFRYLKSLTPPIVSQPREDQLELAFPADRDWTPVGVRVEQRGSALNGLFWGQANAEGVRSQVQRILSLDIDGTDFPKLAHGDPVVADLQQRYPGLRPVGFWSPYEAAAWAVLGSGLRIEDAAALRAAIAEQAGDPIDLGDTILHSFPTPQTLAGLRSFPGLDAVKAGQLRAVAEATITGKLDAFALRNQPRNEALESLQQIPGIDGFAAEHILIRGAGDPDLAPRHDRRLGRAIAAAYGLAQPPDLAQRIEITNRWRPYRSWVTFLVRHHFAPGGNR